MKNIEDVSQDKRLIKDFITFFDKYIDKNLSFYYFKSIKNSFVFVNSIYYFL
jgi:hypothetical protein